MVFSDSTTNGGIVQDVDFLLGTDTTRFPLLDKARIANKALDKVFSLIVGADGRWQFDGTNQTDLPIGTTDLVNTQQDYGISTDMLVITRVEVKDSDGEWKLLIPIDQNDLDVPHYNASTSDIVGGYSQGQSLTAFLDTNGTPLYYDKIANSLFLYPAPNYNSTDGLKVYYQRDMDYFVGDNTAGSNAVSPGFASHLHDYIPYFVAKEYAMKKGMNLFVPLSNKLDSLVEKIVEFYGYRDKDEKVIIRPHVESYR